MDENLLWTAIQKRDSNKDGHFYYGVTSTGVFCRPSCPSRRPRRDRVRFFADSKAAQAAGFPALFALPAARNAARGCRGLYPLAPGREADIACAGAGGRT